MGGSWRSCGGVPEFAGEFLFEYGQKRYVIFTCADHRHAVPRSHRITTNERAELEWRREQERLALAGKRFERPRPLRA
jgi:hypothetical protein